MYLLSVVFPVERTLLLALFTRVRWAVLLLRICAALAFVANKCGNYIAVLTRFRLKEKTGQVSILKNTNSFFTAIIPIT